MSHHHVGGIQNESAPHSEAAQSFRSWSPIPSVHRYSADVDAISNGSFTSQPQLLEDTPQYTTNRFGRGIFQSLNKHNEQVPVFHSTHSRTTKDSMVLQEAWYREDMDRRDRAVSIIPDTYPPGVRSFALGVLGAATI
jgi:hypothetical protein